MTFPDEVQEKTGVKVDSWTYHPNADDMEAVLYFKWPDHDTLPLPWDDLAALNEEYDIEEVEPRSNGRTGSQLQVKINDPY